MVPRALSGAGRQANIGSAHGAQRWDESRKHQRFFADLDLDEYKPKIKAVPDTPPVATE
jgi:hypothetical protein